MATSTEQTKRLEIPMFEGINTMVASNISKKQEVSFCQNARSTKIGLIEKREGTKEIGTSAKMTANYGLFSFVPGSDESDPILYKVSENWSTGRTSLYFLNGSTWTLMTGNGTNLTPANVSVAIAEGSCFIVNGHDSNRYITTTGGSVTTSATRAGNLYRTPIANKINYFKDRLYIADYTIATTNYPNSIMMSSMPLGLASLVDGDYASGVTTIKVTDTKYLYNSDKLDVYRGNNYITTLTVSDMSDYEITVSSTSVDIESADELWVQGTYTGKRVFRWVDNPKSGSEVKEYDTFKLSGSNQNDRIRMMTNIGNVMMIANKNNLSAWNGKSLTNYDLDIGCVADNGSTKALGTLFFIHYTGIYATTGERPKLMSSKVEEFIKGATKSGLEATAAGKTRYSVFFAIGDVTLYYDDGSVRETLEDVCLEYNLRQENWYVHTGIKATHFTTFPQETNPESLQFASKEDDYQVMTFLTENVDSSGDENREIIFRIDSDNLTLGSTFESVCYPLDVIVETERGNGIQVFVSLDNGEFYQLKGDVSKGCAILKVDDKDVWKQMPPRCRRLRISIRDFTKNRCKISRVAVSYIQTAEEEELRRDTHE